MKKILLFCSAFAAGLLISFIFYKPLPTVLTASLTTSANEALPIIPPHISLIDFYNTYGERLLGNNDIKIISREEWGSDNDLCQKKECSSGAYDIYNSFSFIERLRAQTIIDNYQKNFKKYDTMFLQTKIKANGVTYSYLPVEEFIIHHTAGKFTTDFNDSKKELQRIYFLHTASRGWQDIGYHFLIDGAGRIYEGTLGGKYSIGSHAYAHNNGNVAIALMGDFRPGHDEFNDKMKSSLITLMRYLVSEYQLDLSQPNFYLKRPDFSGREWSKDIIKGHQELDIIRAVPTSCPGIDSKILRDLILTSL